MGATPETVRSLEDRLKAQAYGMGYDLVGIATLGEPATRAHFDAWLEAGYHGTMGYLDGDGAELRRDTRRPHPGATHAIVLGTSYGGREPSGPIARYARGEDYHEVLRAKGRELLAWLEAEVGMSVDGRPYVDSGPVLERDLAQRAGLGWFGKNTLLISPRVGSYTFLSAVFVRYPLVADTPFQADRCGSCTRCLDACPTQAFTGPRVLDATRCLSYLTIEFREAIPEALRSAMGSWLYGCDVCQEVCPWNQKFSTALADGSPFTAREWFLEADPETLATRILQLSPEEYAELFRGSAMKRAKLRGLKRNAAVVLGNVGTHAAVEPLTRVVHDDDAMVREHAAWALGQLGRKIR